MPEIAGLSQRNNRVLYISFLDIQPTPANPVRIRFHLDDKYFVSLPSSGPHKSREGLILPLLSCKPVHVSLDPSHPIAIDHAGDTTNQVREIRLVGPGGGFEYAVRLLIVSSCFLENKLEGNFYSPSVVSMAVNDPSCTIDSLSRFLENSTPLELDDRAFALVNFLSLDRAVIFLSKLALTETGPSRVHTTSECRDLCYPVSPLSAFIRSVFRVYLGPEILTHIRPIFVEVCEEAVVLTSKSLADQTMFASLSVRLLTSAIDLVTSKFPIPLCIALEEAFRINLIRITPTSSFLGAYLCAQLIRTCVAFSEEFQIPVSFDSLPLLTRVSSVVVHALVASVDEIVDLPTDDISLTIVNGLAMDIRNKSVSNFNALVSKCHSATTVSDFGAIEKSAPLISSSDNERLAAILSSFVQISRPPAEESNHSPPPELAPETPPFVKLVNEFTRKAFALESSPDFNSHQFHQYHLHKYGVSTHYNSQGPCMNTY